MLLKCSSGRGNAVNGLPCISLVYADGQNGRRANEQFSVVLIRGRGQQIHSERGGKFNHKKRHDNQAFFFAKQLTLRVGPVDKLILSDKLASTFALRLRSAFGVYTHLYINSYTG